VRTDVAHLPAAKQRELERVVRLLFKEFEEARSLATQEWKKKGRILKIILYGSYARGNWVDEPHTAKGYQSDYDLLVIVNDKRLTDQVQYWAKAEERLNRELAITRTLKTPVNFIVHTLHEVNDGLAHGRFFFMDVARDGIAIYQSDTSELAEPKPKTPKQALAMAKSYLSEWHPSAMVYFRMADRLQRDGNLKEAAFILHQTTERLYHCVLLVCTFYTPHVHNLGLLRSQAALLDRRLLHIWATDGRRGEAKFKKLKDAYVKARYSRHYHITSEELAWLGVQAAELGHIIHAICTKRIAHLEQCDSNSECSFPGRCMKPTK
jgi:predicted nucleotidyltransferase